jgi:hypothetical protein
MARTRPAATVWRATFRGLLGLAPGLGACNLVAPKPPEGHRPLEPVPAPYAAWWRITEQCSGLRGDFASVRWSELPGAATMRVLGEDAAGAWYPAARRVVLLPNYVYQGDVVRHEMLHALSRVRGHDRALFLGRCAGVVACFDKCERDAGAASRRDPDAPVRGPDAVEVTTTVWPAVADLPSDGSRAWVAVVVTARNRAAHAVRVRVPSPSGGGPDEGGGFGWYADGLGGALRGSDSVVAFGPGEARHQAFDVPIDPGEPGERRFTVVGRFADRASAPAPVVVRQRAPEP